MNPFQHLVGNETAKSSLKNLLSSKRVPQTLLFSGKEGVGKAQFAKAFAKALLETTQDTHPDLFILEPEGKSGMHSIDSLRVLSKEAMQPPYMAKRKLFLLFDAHRMAAYSSNALLKTFEEPHEATTFILTTHREDQILPTILSRSFTLRFSPLSTHEMVPCLSQKLAASEEEIKTLAALSEGSLGSAFFLADGAKKKLFDAVIAFLAERKRASFLDVIALSKEIHLYGETLRKEQEKISVKVEGVTASQMAEWERGQEGKLKKLLQSLVKALLDTAFLWFRDLQCLRYSGKSAEIALTAYREPLINALERGEIAPLEKMEALVAEAFLSFDRTTPLSHLFESFFLKLSRL